MINVSPIGRNATSVDFQIIWVFITHDVSYRIAERIEFEEYDKVLSVIGVSLLAQLTWDNRKLVFELHLLNSCKKDLQTTDWRSQSADRFRSMYSLTVGIKPTRLAMLRKKDSMKYTSLVTKHIRSVVKIFIFIISLICIREETTMRYIVIPEPLDTPSRILRTQCGFWRSFSLHRARFEE